MGALIASELRRLFRSPRFLIFTIGFPIVYFFLFSGIYANGASGADSIAIISVLMIAMAVFGGISGAVNTGGRVATERGIGWNRQLALTALPAWAYLVVKALVSMLVILPSLVLVFVAGMLKGVELSPLTWLGVLLAAWLGTLPFAAIGLLIGMWATPDSAQPISMVTMLLFSFLGGVLIPATLLPAAMLDIAQALPSYWAVNGATNVLEGNAMSGTGIAVIAAWLVVISGLVVLRYRRAAAKV